jgi:hypothetical protein
VDLNTGQASNRTQGSSTRIAADAVMAGTDRPAASRASLAAALSETGSHEVDREPDPPSCR